MITKEQFAKNLSALVSSSGKTQKSIADDLGVTDVLFNNWVKGKYFPRIDKIEAMASYFNVPRSYLLDDPSQKLSYYALNKNELQLITYYRFMDERGQARLVECAEFLIEKYKNEKAD